MNKYIFIAIFSVGSALSLQASAQGKNFEGFSIVVNGNSASVSTEVSEAGVSEKFGDTSENFILQAAYGVSLGGSGVLGLGGTYTLADFNAGSLRGGTVKGKDMYSLFVEPGFLFNTTTLVYAKASYLNMKGEILLPGLSGSENFDGLGYGAGIRIAFGKTAFWQIELTQSDYNSKSVDGIGFKPSAFNRTIGVGYRF